jgi:diaminopimelate epimerase
MKRRLNTYKFTILRPGGNDTAVVEGIVNKDLRKKINRAIMQKYPHVEQVGFYDFDQISNTYRLEMAGGEFCGNAARSLAHLILKGQTGKINVHVSGTRQILQAGISSRNNAFCFMPIKREGNSMRKSNSNLFIIELEGITHVIVFVTKKYSVEVLKKEAKKILIKTKLITNSVAAGVMFVKKYSLFSYSVDPIVWVRDIGTLFFETACASGTTAIALLLANYLRASKTSITVLQPSKETLTVVVTKKDNKLTSAYIEGNVALLSKGVIKL